MEAVGPQDLQAVTVRNRGRVMTNAILKAAALFCVLCAAILVLRASDGRAESDSPKQDGAWHTEYYRGHSYVMCVDGNGRGGIFHDPDCQCARRKYERAFQAGESQAVRDSIGWLIKTR